MPSVRGDEIRYGRCDLRGERRIGIGIGCQIGRLIPRLHHFQHMVHAIEAQHSRTGRHMLRRTLSR